MGVACRKQPAPAPLHPEHVGSVVALHDEAERVRQLLRPPEQRHDLFRRIAHHLQVRSGYLQGEQHIAIRLLVLFEEGRSPGEVGPPFVRWQQAKKQRFRFPQQIERPVEIRRPESLRARCLQHIAPQILEPVAADGDAEILAGDILQLVRLVEHDRVILGQNAAGQLLILQRQIGEEEMVIDDDDVALGRALVHQRDEAALELLALLAGAQIAARVDLGPGGALSRAAS